MNSNEIEKTILQEWLEKLQEERWQLELLTDLLQSEYFEKEKQ